MTKIRVKVNQRGIQTLFARISSDLHGADRHFRETHGGYPLDVVRRDAPRALPGINLGDDGWDAYAAAVAGGDPFEFELRG